MTNIDVKTHQLMRSVNQDYVEQNDSVWVLTKNKCRC